MSVMSLRRLLPYVAVVMLGSAVLVGTGTGVAMAAGFNPGPPAGGYGPPPPVGPVPGGYFAVVTSQTFGPRGGTIGPVHVGALLVKLKIPAGAFPVPVQITLTAPDVAGIADAGFVGFQAVGGVGILVQENGTAYPGTFLKPLTLTMASHSITRSSIVVVWNGTAFVPVQAATIHKGKATVEFDTDPDFAVLTPVGPPIPGATTAQTGKPFLGEGLLAGSLILLGLGGLLYTRRRRAQG